MHAMCLVVEDLYRVGDNSFSRSRSSPLHPLHHLFLHPERVYVLYTTVIWTLEGRYSAAREEGMETDLPTVYSIISEHIRH
jgi:hypothetical protein